MFSVFFVHSFPFTFSVSSVRPAFYLLWELAISFVTEVDRYFLQGSHECPLSVTHCVDGPCV